MKHIMKTVILLTLVLSLPLMQAACAEPSDTVKGIFDALVAEGSEYSESKAMYKEYAPEMVFEETLRDDGFTITATGSEYMSGSWDFVRDGDTLTTVLSDSDYAGAALVIQVVKAVGDYFGMEKDVLNGYINGLNLLDIKNDNFTSTQQEGGVAFRINIAGPWDMKELDQMVLDEKALFYGALGEDSTSMAANIGKVMMVANGSAEDVTILLGEYGGRAGMSAR